MNPIKYMTLLELEEIHTLIAALRLYQEKGYGEPALRPDHIHDLATNGGESTSLASEDIDTLIEDRLQEAPAMPVAVHVVQELHGDNPQDPYLTLSEARAGDMLACAMQDYEEGDYTQYFLAHLNED